MVKTSVVKVTVLSGGLGGFGMICPSVAGVVRRITDGIDGSGLRSGNSLPAGLSVLN
jgi:hypothetical protein